MVAVKMKKTGHIMAVAFEHLVVRTIKSDHFSSRMSFSAVGLS